jgi:hypothetical protein
MLQWIDELDDMLCAARQRLVASGYRLTRLWS